MKNNTLKFITIAVFAAPLCGITAMADYQDSVLMQEPAVYYRLNTADGDQEINLGSINVGDLAFHNGLIRAAEGPNLPGFEADNKALLLNGGFAQFGALNRSVSELTIVAWVKTPATRKQHQPGIVMSRDPNTSGTATGLEFKTTTCRLGYHWADTASSYGYVSGPIAETSQWNFMAMTVDAEKAVFYLGDSAGILTPTENPVAHNAINQVSPFYIGKDPVSSGDRSLTASDGPATVDEVALFTRALSADDIATLFAQGRGELSIPTRAAIIPSSETIYEGIGTTLSAIGNGAGCEIQWSCDGTVLDTHERVLANPKAGTYILTLSNSQGSVSSEPFTVLPPTLPIITKQPNNIGRYANGKATFSVSVTGTIPFTYQWKLNGQSIEGATESVLTITDLTEADFGNYTVDITNANGTTTSDIAVLKQVSLDADSYAATIMEHKPIAFYRLDDPIDDDSQEFDEETYFTVNGIAYDYASGNDGRYLNSLNESKISGAIKDDSNKAFHFNGVSVIDTPLQMNSLTNTGFTVMGWIKRSLDYGDYTTGSGYFGQRDLFRVSDASGDRMEVLLRNIGNGSVDSIYAAWPFGDSQWGFITVTYDTKEMILYADGINVGNYSGTSPMTAGAANKFCIGGNIMTAWQDFFIGDLDDIAIFDIPMDAELVRSIYNKGHYGAGSAPEIQTQPVGISGYENPDRLWTISVIAAGTGPFTYQWYKNGTEIEGETQSFISGYFTAEEQGTYKVSVSNSFGSITSDNAVISLHIPVVGGYEESVYLMSPFAYWRLGETSGSTAYDYAGGKNGIYTSDNTLGQAGAINGDSDKATAFGGANQIITEPLGLTNTANVTFATWVKPTGRLTTNDKTTLLYNRSGSSDKSATGIDIAGGQIAYHWGDGFYAYRSGLYLLENEWNFVVMSVSATEATFYLGDKQGNLKKAVSTGNHPAINLLARFTLGGDSFYGERKLIGIMDEAVVFDRTLTLSEVEYLYNLGLVGTGSKPVLITTPVAFEGLDGDSVTLTASAKGTPPMTWQWYKDGVAIDGATSPEIVLEGTIEDTGAYTVTVSNAWGSASSDETPVAISYPPYSINLSEGLFTHLRFDENYQDSSTNGNNAEPMGAPEFTDGFLGSALHVQSDFANGIMDYACVYNLYVESNPLSISFWARQETNIPDLPWVSNGENAYGEYGITLSPANGTTGWKWSLGNNNDDTRASANGSEMTLEEWNNYVFVMEPGKTMKTFRNGTLINTTDISGVSVGGFDLGLPLCIGQIGAENYDVVAAFDIDDLGVWQRALTDVEARSIYYVALNGFSFDEEHQGNVPPSVIFQPKGIYTYANPQKNIPLSVGVAGPYPHTVLWYKDGELTDLVGETVSIALTEEAAGSYVAKVSNPYGNAESEAAVIDLIPSEPGSYQELIVNMNPYAYWRLGETEGTTAYEFLSNKWGTYDENNTLGIDGAIHGDSDTAVNFNGSSQVVTDPMNITTANITFLVWIKPLDTRRCTLLFDRLGVGLGKQTSGLEIIDGQLCYHWNDTDTSYNYRSKLYPTAGVWNLAALTVSPATATFYLGTEANGLVSAINNTTHAAVPFEAAFTIGGDRFYADRNFAGIMDEAVVFDRTLTAEEIQSIFNLGIGNIPGKDLVLTYTVNPEEGTITLAWEGDANVQLLKADKLGEEWEVIAEGIEKIDNLWIYTISIDDASKFFTLRR